MFFQFGIVRARCCQGACSKMDSGKCWKIKKFAIRNWAILLAPEIAKQETRYSRVELVRETGAWGRGRSITNTKIRHARACPIQIPPLFGYFIFSHPTNASIFNLKPYSFAASLRPWSSCDTVLSA